MTSEFKQVVLKDLLDAQDLKIVTAMIKKKDWKSVRVYLNSIKAKLKAKGVIPDYLYYALHYKLAINQVESVLR
jgi:hypothetical protein